MLLSADEKRAARAVLEATWDPACLTRAALEEAAAPFGVNPREAYATLLHLDTLDALRGLDFLVFKGGTCVQTYLPPGLQRVSVDLDFNSRHPHPNTVDAAVRKLNASLRGSGRCVTLHGVEYGALLPFGADPQSGTVSYARYLYTPYDDRAIVGGVETQARLIRVQINCKHHELPALDPARREVRFFTQPSLMPRRRVEAECASLADLFADKVLTITKDVGGFGRERIKDFYDLFALRRQPVPVERVARKLDLVASRSAATREAILKGAIERCEDVRARHHEAKGFVTSACAEGKALLSGWEGELERLQDVLDGLRSAASA